jgi:hypothetical protein
VAGSNWGRNDEMAESPITFTPGEVATYYAARLPKLKQGSAAEWRGAWRNHHGNDNFAGRTRDCALVLLLDVLEQRGILDAYRLATDELNGVLLALGPGRRTIGRSNGREAIDFAGQRAEISLNVVTAALAIEDPI